MVSAEPTIEIITGGKMPPVVIPRPVRKLVVGIRFLAVQSTAPPMAAGVTDCHAAFAARNDNSFGRTLLLYR